MGAIRPVADVDDRLGAARVCSKCVCVQPQEVEEDEEGGNLFLLIFIENSPQHVLRSLLFLLLTQEAGRGAARIVPKIQKGDERERG